MIDHEDTTDKDEVENPANTEYARALAAVSLTIPTTTEHAHALAAVSRQIQTGPPRSTIDQAHAIAVEAAA